MEAPLTIVLAVDGLRASALGAYGQTAYETTAFDALAAEARVYEWVYAATPDPADFYAAMAPLLTGQDTVVVTDDPTVTAAIHAAAGRVIEIERADPKAPAATIDATSTAATWGAMAEAVVEALSTGARLVWLHTRGLYGPWDAPPELMESLLDEDDPEVAADVTPPDFTTHDEDERYAATCRYAAEVMTLDACLEGWLDIVAGLLEGEDHRLVVLGLRGFPLGEHGRVGGIDRRLYSEVQHAPLLVREADTSARFDRCATLTTLASALAAVLANEEPSGDGARLSSADAWAVLLPGWMLRAPATPAAEAELYVKPDDRWEQNDVASLEDLLVAELLSTLSPRGNSGVASGDRGH